MNDSENPKVPTGAGSAVSFSVESMPVVTSSASVKKETLNGDNFAENEKNFNNIQVLELV